MDLGLTRQTLALRLGCWYQSVASWEREESLGAVAGDLRARMALRFQPRGGPN
jgi:hypothetical protein